MSEIEKAAADMWPEWQLTNGDYAHNVFIMGARKLLELADRDGYMRDMDNGDRYIDVLRKLIEGES